MFLVRLYRTAKQMTGKGKSEIGIGWMDRIIHMGWGGRQWNLMQVPPDCVVLNRTHALIGGDWSVTAHGALL